MSKHGGATALSLVFGVLALLVLIVPASSQAQVQKQANRPALAADGHPDLNGIWQALADLGVRPALRHFASTNAIAYPRKDAWPSLVRPCPSPRPPVTWASAV